MSHHADLTSEAFAPPLQHFAPRDRVRVKVSVRVTLTLTLTLTLICNMHSVDFYHEFTIIIARYFLTLPLTLTLTLTIYSIP